MNQHERDQLDAIALRNVDPWAYKVFRCLMRHADAEGYCWPGHKLIARETGITKSDTITRCTSALRALKVVFVEQTISNKDGRPSVNLYRLGSPIGKIPVRCSARGLVHPRRTGIHTLPCAPPSGEQVSPRAKSTSDPPSNGFITPSRVFNSSSEEESSSYSSKLVEVQPSHGKPDDDQLSAPSELQTRNIADSESDEQDAIEQQLEKAKQIMRSLPRFAGCSEQQIDALLNYVDSEVYKYGGQPRSAQYWVTCVRNLSSEEVQCVFDDLERKRQRREKYGINQVVCMLSAAKTLSQRRVWWLRWLQEHGMSESDAAEFIEKYVDPATGNLVHEALEAIEHSQFHIHGTAKL